MGGREGGRAEHHPDSSGRTVMDKSIHMSLALLTTARLVVQSTPSPSTNTTSPSSSSWE